MATITPIWPCASACTAAAPKVNPSIPVKRCRLTAAPQMAEDHGARFLARQFLQLASHDLADTAEPLDVTARRSCFQCQAATDRLRALGRDNDGMTRSAIA